MPRSTPGKPTVAQALLILGAVAAAVAGYLLLSAALGLRESYVGFLFLFYWLTFDQGKVKSLPTTVLGMTYGLALAWLLQYAPHSASPSLMTTLFLIAVALSIVCLVVGWFPQIINAPAMLMLTVFTIPHIQEGAHFTQLYLALAFAVVFFVGLVAGLTRLVTMVKKPTSR
jgi:hypothetical protein